MWDCWKQLKLIMSGPIKLQKETGERPNEDHDFDAIRLIMHNLERQFVDVPILSVQANVLGEKEWAIATRRNESASAYACSYVMRDMLAKQE